MPQTLSIEEFDARYGQPADQPRTLTLEQFEAREATSASETPSALENFYEGAIKAPARNLYAGYLQSGGGLYDLGANLAMIGNRLGAVDREGKPAFRETEANLREMAQELYGESLQYMGDNILAKVYQGLGAAPAAIAELISGTRLLRSAPAAFSVVEALHAADKGPEEVALAATRGALVGGAFKAAEPLTRAARVGTLTTIGGAQGTAAGGDVEDVTAGAATLGILGMMGGPGPAARRAAKAQRLEPTIAPRTATPETILELTERATPEPRPGISAAPVSEIPRTAEPPATVPTAALPTPRPAPSERISQDPRVEPSTIYTARVIREPGGTPTPPGRLAERGKRFERGQTPERTFVPGAPPEPPKGKPRNLAAYLQSKGGLNDVGGDVRAALDRNIMPGLINLNRIYGDNLRVRQTSKRGMGLDDAASLAQQVGWFPELRHRTAGPDDLIDALRREQTGEILDHPDNAEHLRYQEDSRAFEESEYARERAFDAEIERQVEALDYDTSDFPFDETPPVPARLTEEAGLVGGRPEEAARPDPDARARDAAPGEGALPTEVTPQGSQTILPGAERTTGKEFVEAQADKRIKGTKAQKPADDGLFDVAGRGQTELLTFPGPLPALKQQWHRAATEIIDWLAEGKYSPFARSFLKGYPFKDPTMGRLPERAEYLGRRGETQGIIYRTNRVASRLNDALRKAPVEAQRAALDYLTTREGHACEPAAQRARSRRGS